MADLSSQALCNNKICLHLCACSFNSFKVVKILELLLKILCISIILYQYDNCFFNLTRGELRCSVESCFCWKLVLYWLVWDVWLKMSVGWLLMAELAASWTRSGWLKITADWIWVMKATTTGFQKVYIGATIGGSWQIFSTGLFND